MILPIFQDSDQNFMLMQTSWASVINPLLKASLFQGILLPPVLLIDGVNTINHLLSRTQQGWIITDIQGPATIYRSAPFNSQTLILTSNGMVTVTLYVY